MILKLAPLVKKKYPSLSKNKYCVGKYCITPLRRKDIQKIRIWRNEQIDVLRQTKLLSKKEQIRYYNGEITRSFYQKQPKMILFSILLNDSCIGYGGLVHIDWSSKRGEISIITKTERNYDQKIYRKDFRAFFKLIKKLAFEELGLNRLVTETYEIRPYVIKLLEDMTFKEDRRMKKKVKIKEKYFDSLIHGCLKTYT